MNRVRYSTNWMGPISLNWYRDRGFTQKVTKILEQNSPISDKKKGDVVEYDEITVSYSGGRIDFFNPHNHSPYPDEMAVPLMRSEDWNRFSDWLSTFEPDEIWEFCQLVWMYEKANKKIEWYETPEWYPYDPNK